MNKVYIINKVEEKRDILHTLNRRKANWTGHIMRRNGLRKHITEGELGEGIEVTRRRRRGHKQILDDLKKTRGCGKLKDEALDPCGKLALEDAARDLL
jgi:hypothetical protein